MVVCYYASWGIYRPGNGTFKMKFIDPKLCTHVIYSFAGLNLNGEIDSLDFSNDITAGERSHKQMTDNYKFPSSYQAATSSSRS